MTDLDFTEAEREFRSLLAAPKAFAVWAREVRQQWEARRQAEAVRAVQEAQAAQAEAERIQKRAKRKGKK